MSSGSEHQGGSVQPTGSPWVPAGLGVALLLTATGWWWSTIPEDARTASARPAGTATEPSTAAMRAPSAQSPLARVHARSESPDLAEPTDDELQGSERPSRKEREFHARFLELGRQDPLALQLRAAEVLADNVADAQKVAVLRALQDLACPARAQLIASAALDPRPPVAGGNVSVAWFAVELLRRNAITDAEARVALHMVAWSAGAEPELRRNAAAALAASGTREDLLRLEFELSREPDARIREAAVAALAGHADRPLAQWIHFRMGAEEPLPTPAAVLEE